MNFFNLFRTKSEVVPVVEAEEQRENLISEDETKQKDDGNKTVFINYGTGMPIDIIYSFVNADLESKGYEDALSNPDTSYKEMNKALIRSKLEVKFQRVLLRYENDLQDIDFHINSLSEAGLVDVVGKMKMRKSIFMEHVKRVNTMKQDFQNNALYMTGMLLSYERGFLKGLAAVSLNHLQLNVNEEKEGGIL